ncbi:hypothetical protein [Bosea vestrisii]|uniref:Thymidylate kinase n=1 Tax=Bosea vestrisii TaxID=151416 RepID=A0ABW0HIG5_9HYPH
MTLFVAIEGADGAGKATAATNVREALARRGISAVVISFPRYGQTSGGFAIGQFLAGQFPVTVTPKAAAVLYALDRLESVSFVSQAAQDHEVVIFDRYIASNMVYQASKVPASEALALMSWIYQLEINTFGVEKPNVSFYLNTSLEFARKLMALKGQRSYTDKQYDAHEADEKLQLAVRQNYDLVTKSGLAGPWHVVEAASGCVLRSPSDIASEITDHVLEQLRLNKDENRRSTTSRA